MKPKASEPSPSEIHRLLFMTAKQAHQGVERWFSKEKIGITPLQFGVLRSMGQDGLTLNDLARRMMFKPPSILPAVDLLERKGCVMRRNDPHDRRKVQLIVTAKGKKIVQRVIGNKKPDPLGTAFQRLSAKKKKQLMSMLEEINDGMSKR